MGAAAASSLPEQNRTCRYIPSELVEEILVRLPVKSLLRFSTVSKSWNLIISDPQFIGKHRSAAALPGRERILVSHSTHGSLIPSSTLPLSSISSNQTIHDAPPLICPFTLSWSATHLLASCDGLWCVEHDASLFLWNPSMRTHKKLPLPSIHLQDPLDRDYQFRHHFCFGIGYDSFADDYKILKLRCDHNHTSFPNDELYSLKNDSWRKIQTFPQKLYQFGKGVFTSSGSSLHWVGYPHHESSLHEPVILSFNLRTEKYAEVAQPPYDPEPRFEHDLMKLSDIRGKLCLHLNYYDKSRYCFWVMQDQCNYSWSTMVDVDYCSVEPYPERCVSLTALYFYDDGKILIKSIAEEYPTTLMFIDDKSEPQFGYRCTYDEYISGHLYVENLVSPAKFSSRKQPPVAARGRPKPRGSFVCFSSFVLYHFISILCWIVEIVFKWKEKLPSSCFQ